MCIREDVNGNVCMGSLGGGNKESDVQSIALGKRIPDETSFSQERYEVLTGEHSSGRLSPYEPDILGEMFVLEFLKPTLFSKRVVRDFAQALWRNDHFALGGWHFI